MFSGTRSPSGILLNIALFIPFGWFLASLSKRKRVLVRPILLTITIELIQLYTGRGMFDIDDVISNALGGVIGCLLFWGVEEGVEKIGWKKLIPLLSILLLGAGGYGVLNTTYTPTLQTDFEFGIDQISWDGDAVTLSGSCYVYNGETPAYTVMLGRTRLKTEIDGERFIAIGKVENKTQEIRVQFAGHESFTTTLYLQGDKLKYTAEEPQIEGVPADWTLKAYSPKFDTLVYQDGDRLLWLIGYDIEDRTEIIYHISTNELENLPENRKMYGFDNRGFHTYNGTELESIGKYRVFQKEVPGEYYVTEVVVGFNTSGKVTWEQNFRIDYEE